jgi:hypothetical protein
MLCSRTRYRASYIILPSNGGIPSLELGGVVAA